MSKTSSPNSLVSRIRNSSPVSYLRGLRHRGTAMVDMVILLGLISLVSIGAVGLAGGQVSHVFCEAAGTIDVSLGGKGFCLGKPAVSQAWIKSHTNPNFNPTFSFKDQLFAQGTSGTQTVMVPKTGDYTEAMTFSVAAPGPEAFAACVEQNKGDTPVCGTASTSASSVTVAPTDYAVGYSVTLPGNTGQAVSDDIALTLATTTQDHLKKTWNINVGRTSTGQAFSTSMVFADHAFPAGAIGNQHFVMVPVPAGLTAPLTFSTNGNGNVALAPCYEVTSSATPVCTGSDSSGIQSETVSPSTYAIGYQVSLPSNNTTSDWSQQIALSLSEAGLTGSQSWTPTLSRPAGAVIFEPQMTFSDLSVPANTSGYETILVPIQGNFTTNLNWGTDGLSGTIPVGACVTNGSTDIYDPARGTSNPCPTPSTGTTTNSITLSDVGNTENYLGYAVNLGASNTAGTALDQNINLTLATSDSSQSKTYSVHITRPSSPNEFTSNTTFADITIPAGGNGKYGDTTEPYQFSSNFQTGYTLTASNNVPGSTVLCYRSSSTTLGSCGGPYTTSGGYQWGYSLDLSSDPRPASAIDGYIDVVATSTTDTSLSKTWAIHVTRPAMTNVAAPSATFNDVVAATSDASKEYYQSASYTAPPSPNTYHLTASGAGTLSVAPCYYVGTSQACAAYSTDGSVSQAVDTGATQLGFSIDFSSVSIFTAIDQNITLTATSDQDPSVTKSWTVHVSRPAAQATMPVAAVADVSVAAGTTSKYLDWGTITSAANGTVDLTSDGAGTLSVAACYYRPYTNPAQHCSAYSTGVSSAEAVPTQASSLGIEIDFSSFSIYQAIDQDITLHAVSEADPTVTKTWTIHVTRPATPVTVADATFNDYTAAAGTTGGQIDWSASYTKPTATFDLTTDGAGTLSVKPCYYRSGTYCSGFSTGTSTSLAVPVYASQIGFEMDLSSVSIYQAIDQDITLHAVSEQDPTVTKSWTVHVSRPAVPLTVGDATFSDLAVPAGTTSANFDWSTSYTRATAGYTLTASGGPLTLRACNYYVVSTYCTPWATGTTTAGRSVQITSSKIGFQVDFSKIPTTTAIDQYVTLTAVSQQDSSVTKTYTIHVTRPAS